MRICFCICVVMGPAWLAGAERNFSTGDSIGGAKYCGLCKHVYDISDCAAVPVDALSHEVRPVRLLRIFRRNNDSVHLSLPAGDQEHSH